MLPYRLLRPALGLIEPEAAHRLAIHALRMGLAGGRSELDDPILATRVLGLAFPNPIGLAAGFDKNAEVMESALTLGFGFVEAGTVTPLPQPGNPKPRLFRLDEDRAAINRLGFNSGGLEGFCARLAARRARGASGIVGANLGKNRTSEDAAADYVRGIEGVASLADYLVVNVSSPNTPGLRSLQARAAIEALLTAVLEARRRAVREAPPPLLAKVGPDLSEEELHDIVEVALALGIDGLIIGNTTVTRPAGLKSRHRDETGGLSGRPLMPLSTACLAAAYRISRGKLPLIGCGGVASGADAYAKIRAGASLVQLYTAMVFEGPEVVIRIRRELAALLRKDGFKSVGDAVGAG
jgi:dihydroorotate dehydrogenase